MAKSIFFWENSISAFSSQFAFFSGVKERVATGQKHGFGPAKATCSFVVFSPPPSFLIKNLRPCQVRRTSPPLLFFPPFGLYALVRCKVFRRTLFAQDSSTVQYIPQTGNRRVENNFRVSLLTFAIWPFISVCAFSRPK